ncbi:hypothetical protein [Candidatus Villigracilis proximus]|uniref:hypothetical protein n=1 Tax=Candidatus Villigracilis proximus TaxID=3140683 RepID=UPI0031EEB7BC
MIDLTTTYLGLQLKNPLVASASPLSKDIDKARKLEEAGIAAIVMYSLFEEQIIHESLELDHYLTRGTDSFAEAMTYLPDGGMYAVGPEKYLNQVAGLKKALKHPRHWKFKRCIQRRLDELRKTDTGSRSRCVGTESVLHPN